MLIGDSFIEGTGYDYEYTIGGLLQNELGNKYEVLNSDVNIIHNIQAYKLNNFDDIKRHPCTLEKSGPKLLDFLNKEWLLLEQNQCCS